MALCNIRKVCVMKWNDYRKKINYVTRGAFIDLKVPGFVPAEDYKQTWTVADEDHDGYYSFRKWFLKFYQDPTEVEFVKECFEGDMVHWEQFKNSRDLNPIYKQLKKEAEQLLLADAMRKIVEVAMDTSNKNSLTALKYLADRGTKVLGEPVNKGGRPKKEDIAKAAREMAQEDKDLMKDLARING